MDTAWSSVEVLRWLLPWRQVVLCCLRRRRYGEGPSDGDGGWRDVAGALPTLNSSTEPRRRSSSRVPPSTIWYLPYAEGARAQKGGARFFYASARELLAFSSLAAPLAAQRAHHQRRVLIVHSARPATTGRADNEKL